MTIESLVKFFCAFLALVALSFSNSYAATAGLGIDKLPENTYDTAFLKKISQSENSNQTPEKLGDFLIEAAAYGHLRSAHWLIKKGASPNHIYRTGITPLIATFGYPKDMCTTYTVTKLLTENGADEGLIAPQGQTALLAFASYALEAKIDNEVEKSSGLKVIPWKRDKHVEEEIKSCEAATLEVLIKRRKVLEALNKNGDSALWILERKRRYDLIIELGRAGANLNSSSGNSTDRDGSTIIFYAPHDQVAALVAAGADPNAQNKKGDTPLHKAISEFNFRKNPDLYIKELLNAGARDRPNNAGKLAIEITPPREISVLELLSSKGKEVNPKEHYEDEKVKKVKELIRSY